jgi:hypothetical protein
MFFMWALLRRTDVCARDTSSDSATLPHLPLLFSLGAFYVADREPAARVTPRNVCTLDLPQLSSGTMTGGGGDAGGEATGAVADAATTAASFGLDWARISAWTRRPVAAVARRVGATRAGATRLAATGAAALALAADGLILQLLENVS